MIQSRHPQYTPHHQSFFPLGCHKDTGHRRVPMAENGITRQTRHVVRCYAVRDSALPIFGRIPCLETPETRIQNCANAILPKSRTAGPGRPVFRDRLLDGSLFTAPPAFLGWHCDPGSQSDNGRHAELEISQRPPARSICFGPPCGARSRGPASIFLPTVFYATQRPDWSAFNVSTAAGPIRMPQLPEPNATPWENRRVTPSVSRDAVPASPTGPLLVLAPPVNDRQGRC